MAVLGMNVRSSTARCYGAPAAAIPCRGAAHVLEACVWAPRTIIGPLRASGHLGRPRPDSRPQDRPQLEQTVTLGPPEDTWLFHVKHGLLGRIWTCWASDRPR